MTCTMFNETLYVSDVCFVLCQTASMTCTMFNETLYMSDAYFVLCQTASLMCTMFNETLYMSDACFVLCQTASMMCAMFNETLYVSDTCFVQCQPALLRNVQSCISFIYLVEYVEHVCVAANKQYNVQPVMFCFTFSFWQHQCNLHALCILINMDNLI